MCLGNICRSPLAEGILRRQAREAGVSIQIDSAGTGDWHSGQPPDRRAAEEGKRRGCEMNMRARQVRSSDFLDFDLIVAMDRSNESDLKHWAGSDPSKVRLARSFDPNADGMDVPDPYYGGSDHFKEVGDMLEASCRGILNEISAV